MAESKVWTMGLVMAWKMTKDYKIDRDISTSIEQIEFVHSLIQELENKGVELPMGDYNLIYDYIEGARDILMEYEETMDFEEES
jgi:hypothetical protein